MTDTVATLSAPADRWRPSRAGLVNVWRYWDETFTFHRGRLLLRGPNGSGKSMALELLLPFLLDADASPTRLTSAAKSRGGLFDRVMTGTDEASRTGFLWVEFVRRDQVFTVGARIRASQATRKAEADFFTTSLAVGRELQLLDGTRTPLSKKALEEAIGETGRVHGSAEEHRAALREVLFPEFGDDRYASVIGALLALRKEKLSQNLDLDKLSRVLSDALPPIDEHDIAVVAEGFERLDRRRAELAGLERELAEVRQLGARQRDYARALVVGVAGDVRSAETRRDDVTRTERRAREDLATAQAEAQALGVERQALEERDEAIGVEIDALKDSTAYRDGAALADLRKQAARLREVATRTERSYRERAEAHARASDDLDEAASVCATAASNLERARRDLREPTEAAGASAVADEAARVDDADEAERLVQAWVGAQRGFVESVRAALDAYERAVAERQFREDQVAADEAAVGERASASTAAVAAVEAALVGYHQAVAEWAAGCETLEPARVLAVLPPRADPQAVAETVADLAAAVQAQDAVARRDLAAERQAATGDRQVLEAERTRWAAEGLPDPEPASWRADRTGRAGAPLWRLVDLAAGVPSAAVDGLEAALTGAGLLDAWVQPDGSVDLGPTRADVVLTVRPVAGETVASVLVPAARALDEDPLVAPEVVAAVLSSVALADTIPALAEAPGRGAQGPDVVIARDGTYRLGSAVGRGPARQARLLGAVARERHRLARLSELDAALADVDARRRDIDSREAALDRRKAAVEAELAAVPSSGPVDDAERAAATAAARLREAEVRLEASGGAVRAAEEGVRGALRSLTALGARHGVPTDRAGLAGVEAALARLAEVVAVWARRRRELRALEREHRRSIERASRAEQEAARAAQEHADSEREAVALEGRVEALESSVGAEYRDLLGRLSALDGERAAARRRLRELSQRGPVLDRRVGELESKVETAAAARLEAEGERERAQRRLVAAADELGPDAGIRPGDPLDTASAVLGFARAVAADHPRVDAQPQTVERLSERVREAVHQAQTVLGARVDLDRELAAGGWWVLRTAVGGVRRRASDLSAALAAELAQGREELAAEEERLFEQTLTGSVRRAVAARIRQANDLVDHVNVHLAGIRTAAGGVRVRLRWEVDPDQLEAVKAARSLLLRDPADLGEHERASLQAFVRARVDQARAELEPNAPWEARLRETLDYRAWHRFTLQIGHRDWEEFQPATPRRLQKLSTGERSIALHLPMIASVAAHYAGENGKASVCPRLILLDELFAGVDSANRAQLFGTFTAWDLDAVFTSDHEWCQYATLDGIAIHHLHPPTGEEPVTSTRFTWDGRHRRVDPTAA